MNLYGQSASHIRSEEAQYLSDEIRSEADYKNNIQKRFEMQKRKDAAKMRLRTGHGDRKKILYKDNPLLLEQRYQNQIPMKS